MSELCIADCGKDKCHYFGIVSALPEKCRFHPQCTPSTVKIGLLYQAALKAATARKISNDVMDSETANGHEMTDSFELCRLAEAEFAKLYEQKKEVGDDQA